MDIRSARWARLLFVCSQNINQVFPKLPLIAANSANKISYLFALWNIAVWKNIHECTFGVLCVLKTMLTTWEYFWHRIHSLYSKNMYVVQNPLWLTKRFLKKYFLIWILYAKFFLKILDHWMLKRNELYM